MDISPVKSVGNSADAALSTNAAPAGNDIPVRQVVAAIHEINKSELMGEGKQLSFTRDPDTRRPVIQIIDQSTGEVLDQLPPESLLRLAEQLK